MVAKVCLVCMTGLHSNPAFINELYEVDGIRYFFLDEVHKYPGWDQELKNIYDSYPDINIVFSGSSSMDLIHGTYDLSRRSVLYRLNGMSFREYLEFSMGTSFPIIGFKDLISNPETITDETGFGYNKGTVSLRSVEKENQTGRSEKSWKSHI